MFLGEVFKIISSDKAEEYFTNAKSLKIFNLFLILFKKDQEINEEIFLKKVIKNFQMINRIKETEFIIFFSICEYLKVKIIKH